MTYWSGALDTGDEYYSILVNEKEEVIVVPLWPPGGGFVNCQACGHDMGLHCSQHGCCPLDEFVKELEEWS